MTLKDLIKAEIDNLPAENLDEIYEIIKSFVESKNKTKPGLLSKLKQIKIQAPEDFSANIDSYINGEK